MSDEPDQCGICFENGNTVKYRKVLPCIPACGRRNQFCEQCLVQWSMKHEGKFTCPACREQVYVQPGDVSALPTVYVSGKLKCAVCLEAKSCFEFWWCPHPECQQLICSRCGLKYHNKQHPDHVDDMDEWTGLEVVKFTKRFLDEEEVAEKNGRMLANRRVLRDFFKRMTERFVKEVERRMGGNVEKSMFTDKFGVLPPPKACAGGAIDPDKMRKVFGQLKAISGWDQEQQFFIRAEGTVGKGRIEQIVPDEDAFFESFMASLVFEGQAQEEEESHVELVEHEQEHKDSERHLGSVAESDSDVWSVVGNTEDDLDTGEEELRERSTSEEGHTPSPPVSTQDQTEVKEGLQTREESESGGEDQQPVHQPPEEIVWNMPPDTFRRTWAQHASPQRAEEPETNEMEAAVNRYRALGVPAPPGLGLRGGRGGLGVPARGFEHQQRYREGVRSGGFGRGERPSTRGFSLGAIAARPPTQNAQTTTWQGPVATVARPVSYAGFGGGGFGSGGGGFGSGRDSGFGGGGFGQPNPAGGFGSGFGGGGFGGRADDDWGCGLGSGGSGRDDRRSGGFAADTQQSETRRASRKEGRGRGGGRGGRRGGPSAP